MIVTEEAPENGVLSVNSPLTIGASNEKNDKDVPTTLPTVVAAYCAAPYPPALRQLTVDAELHDVVVHWFSAIATVWVV